MRDAKDATKGVLSPQKEETAEFRSDCRICCKIAGMPSKHLNNLDYMPFY